MSVIQHKEFEKSEVFNVLEMNEYLVHEIVEKIIIQRATGNISIFFFDKGEQLMNTLTRFDNMIQIIEGKAQIVINDASFILNSGQALIIPANSKNTIIACEQFKMISTIIKSGYE